VTLSTPSSLLLFRGGTASGLFLFPGCWRLCRSSTGRKVRLGIIIDDSNGGPTTTVQCRYIIVVVILHSTSQCNQLVMLLKKEGETHVHGV